MQELLAQMVPVFLGLPWSTSLPHIAQKPRTAARPLNWRACCASTACSNGATCRIGAWRMPSLTPRFNGNFAQIDAHGRLPGGCTHLRLSHRLKKHKLRDQILATFNELLAAQGLLAKAVTALGATLIAAPNSTKNIDKKPDPQMHSSQKGNEWHFGTKSHIGADAVTGLVHTVCETSGSVSDVVECNSLLHGEEMVLFSDAGDKGAQKHPVNGWYRVAYDNGTGACYAGYPPFGLSNSFPTGGYAIWGAYYPVIDDLARAIYALADSTDPSAVAFIRKHYGGLSPAASTNNRMVEQLMFWPTLVR